jgi:hypothetical protein
MPQAGASWGYTGLGRNWYDLCKSVTLNDDERPVEPG